VVHQIALDSRDAAPRLLEDDLQLGTLILDIRGRHALSNEPVHKQLRWFRQIAGSTGSVLAGFPGRFRCGDVDLDVRPVTTDYFAVSTFIFRSA
jgi:hypothetical protein